MRRGQLLPEPGGAAVPGGEEWERQDQPAPADPGGGSAPHGDRAAGLWPGDLLCLPKGGPSAGSPSGLPGGGGDRRHPVYDHPAQTGLPQGGL
mgnify:CR=1 FL=1